MNINDKQIDLTTEFDIILKNKGKYNDVDVYKAVKQSELEKSQALKAGLSVEELRLRKYTERVKLSSAIDAMNTELKKKASSETAIFGRSVLLHLSEMCIASGNKFTFHDEETKLMYADIIRYFWAPDELIYLAPNKGLDIYGSPGNGKSSLVKAILAALKFYRGEQSWKYFHIPTILNKCIEAESVSPFKAVLSCTKNMVLDELGDPLEASKIFANPLLNQVRSLMMDKYDKWITQNRSTDFQKIVITSNLFPDTTHFYTQKENPAEDTRETFESFYGYKCYQRLEMFNLIRFPKVSFRKIQKINFDI